MNRIAILHFGSLELYPPIQNFLHLLESRNDGKEIYIFTTRTNVSSLKKIVSTSGKIKIIRLGISGQNLNSFKRYISYGCFYIGSLIYILYKRPSAILYYETLSSYPAYLYKRFFNTKMKLFIHYHEYTSPKEYENGMVLSRYFYRKEKYLYPIAQWVSHTNEHRMQKFLKDIEPIKVQSTKILPNYPPGSWIRSPELKEAFPVKAVYVGSLSIDTMYTKTFIEWVMAQNGKIIFDIYSHNITTAAKIFLRSLQCDWITVKDGANYDELPGILKKYDIGVILYKGHIDNYIYNAPNKLFEYLAIGLDVWFPDIMQGSTPYITNKTYPKVISVNFDHLNTFILSEAINKEGYILKTSTYYSEKALDEIATALFNN
jgi:hypothetical protein